MSKPIRWLIVLGGCLLGLAACGGSMTLTDYFDELQAASDEAEASYLAVTRAADEGLAGLAFSPRGGWESDAALAGEQLLWEITDEAQFSQQAVDIDVMIYGGLQDMLAGILARIEDMDPPDQAMDPHAEMVSAAVEWADLVADLTNALTGAGSATELVERLAPLDLDARFSAIDVRFESACLSLQAVAELDAEATVRFSGPWLGRLSADNATADFACG